MDALLIVDVQNDFCPGGALGAPEGDKVVPVINKIIRNFELVIASKDWHPKESTHFENWPYHCVQGSQGAEFHPGLETGKIDKIFLKGTTGEDDGYSAFEATNMDLADYLRQRDVKRLFIAGLATDYCVKQTALSSVNAGFETIVVQDAIRPVNVNPGDGEKAVEEMKEAGCQFVTSDKIQ